MRQIFFTITIFFIVFQTFAQTNDNPLLTSDAEAQKKWVNDLYNSMTLAEKIGQLYMVQVKSNQEEADKKRSKIILDLLH